MRNKILVGLTTTVTAILKPVEDKSSGETEIEVVAVSETSTSSESTAETTSTTPPAGAIVVATVAAPAPNAAPSPISGTKAAVNVTMDLTKVTPIQYKTAVIENITAAPAGGALNIVTDRVSVLDAKMINAIAARPDIDVNIVFTYMGKKIKVTIPAGYDVSKLLDPYGYCGFLRLLDILGGTEIK